MIPAGRAVPGTAKPHAASDGLPQAISVIPDRLCLSASSIDPGHREVPDEADDEDGQADTDRSPTPAQAAEAWGTPIQSANEAPSGRVMM